MNPIYTHFLIKIFGFPIFVNFKIIMVSTVISLLGTALVIMLRDDRKLAINVGVITIFASFIPYFIDFIRIITLRLFLFLFHPFMFPHFRYLFLIHNPETWGIIAGVSLIILGYYKTYQTHELRPLNDDKIIEYVKNIAEELNVKMPRIFYYDSSAPNLYTNGSTSNPYIAISVGALELFTDEELRAALAHEISHIINNENEITLTSLGLSLAAFANVPNYIINLLIRRNSEFLADEKAASIVGPKPVISALLKVASFSTISPGFSFVFSITDLILGRPSIEARINHLIKIYNIQ